MCGIGGVIGEASPITASALGALGSAMVHRGPDDAGFLTWDGRGAPVVGRRPTRARGSQASFVHRRLSIIDLTADAWQPMSTPDGRFHLVFNGEVYNYIELRRELAAEGQDLMTASDTEVLLRGFAHWGTGVFGRIVGMFAMAILDTARRRVTLARDPFGIKPLYTMRYGSSLAFASEIPALLTLPGVTRRANPETLYDYLGLGLVDHRLETMFEGIDHFPPAHFVTVDIDRPVAIARRYWDITQVDRVTPTFAEAAAELRRRFLDDVSVHLRSDVLVGTALSGGIDSSSIVSAIRAVQGEGVALRTFSYLSGDPRTDEEQWVDLMTAATRAESTKVSFDEDALIEGLDSLVRLQGEPFASSSIAAQRKVFDAAARNGVRVMLDGQGADELFAGYPAFIGARCASLISDGRVAAAVRLAWDAGPEPMTVSLGRALIALLPGPLSRGAVGLTGAGRTPRWLNRAWFSGTGAPTATGITGTDRRTLHAALVESTIRSSLPALLRYEDRNSMAVSVESRVPFLTTSLVEWALALPEDYIVGNHGTTKRVLRAAMRGIVPDPVLDRRDKIGFSTPEGDWLRRLGPWVTQVLDSAADWGHGPILLREARAEWQSVLHGSRPYDSRIWRWLNLIRWAELYEVSFD